MTINYDIYVTYTQLINDVNFDSYRQRKDRTYIYIFKFGYKSNDIVMLSQLRTAMQSK